MRGAGKQGAAHLAEFCEHAEQLRYLNVSHNVCRLRSLRARALTHTRQDMSSLELSLMFTQVAG